MIRLLAALCLAWLAGAAQAQAFEAQVVAVVDGDTVVVAQGRRKITVRLADIDAPESAQPYGAASRQSLASLVMGKVLTIVPRVKDEYGRTVAALHVDGVNVSEAQIARGMAWEYSYHHANRKLAALQEDARRAQRGLWAQAQPVPPWEFRRPQAVARNDAGAVPTCGNKHYCSQMRSCEEAQFYFAHCRVRTLDRNGDGVPCDKLCGALPRR
jgi:endonuclease YncB( thermonuclease family)